MMFDITMAQNRVAAVCAYYSQDKKNLNKMQLPTQIKETVIPRDF